MIRDGHFGQLKWESPGLYHKSGSLQVGIFFPSQGLSCFREVGTMFQTLEPLKNIRRNWLKQRIYRQNREGFCAKILWVSYD